MRRSLILLSVLITLIGVNDACLKSLNGADVVLGGVYATDGKSILLDVAELLRENVLSGDAGWVSTSELATPVTTTLAKATQWRCINRRWQKQTWTIELLGTQGKSECVRGASELADILNRPFTGSLSNRIEELQIAGMQQQASNAIANCQNAEKVVVCTSRVTLHNPKFRLCGYDTQENAMDAAAAWAHWLKLEVGSLTGPDQGEGYLVELTGTLVHQATFRVLNDAEPRFGRDRMFFLSDEYQGDLGISAANTGLSLRQR